MQFKEFYENSINEEKQLISEDINDKNIFKAVFMAGGPGSGKGFIGSQMFKGEGVKFVNSDLPFEFLLKKGGISLDIDPANIERFTKQMEKRGVAKELTKKLQKSFMDGMIPIIIDGTGKDLKKIKSQKEALEKLGYDTAGVFVNTSLEVAQERNKKRERSVPDEIVEQGWKDVQKNKRGFLNLFNDSIEVQNTEVLKGKAFQDFSKKMRVAGRKMLDKPLKNSKGKNVISYLKRTGGKLLSDIPKSVSNKDLTQLVDDEI